MKTTILHVFSSDFISGSTIYTIRLAEKQQEWGNKVHLISDSSTLPTSLACMPLPVSDRSYTRRFKNILFLCRYIKTHQIAIVHAHSRAASWISYFACRICKVVLVSTIHGRQFKNDDKYGEYVIAICENLCAHLTNELHFDSSKIILVPNGINTPGNNVTEPGERFKISFVGRFNGPKGKNIADLLLHVFPKLLKDHPNLEITLVGGNWQAFPEEAKSRFDSLSSEFPGRIQKFDFIENPFEIMSGSHLVIGAGRVAIEALSLGRPVLALGEGCYHGLITKENIQSALASNFGDIMPKKNGFQPDCSKILLDIQAFVKEPITADFRPDIARNEIGLVTKNVLDIYRKALLKNQRRKYIPVLMYHKVPDKKIDSPHKIYVTKRRFRKHLLFFRLRRMKSITFKEYHDFVSGDRPMSQYPRRPFILTFDDGYEDNYHNMLPLTRQYGFKGVLFLLGDFGALQNFWDQGEPPHSGRLMTLPQKMEFVRCGWEIGAHTLTHCDLTKQTDSRVMEELTESRRRLEETLGTKVISFAYPYGYVDKRVKELVPDAGYTYGVSTDSGGMTIDEDPFEVFRVNMFPNESFFQLYKKTSSWYRKYYKRRRGK